MIVPPSASVDIKGAIDNIFSDARHKNAFTLIIPDELSFSENNSVKFTPLSPSLEKSPGLDTSPVIGFGMEELLLEQLEIKIIRGIINIFLYMRKPFTKI